MTIRHKPTSQLEKKSNRLLLMDPFRIHFRYFPDSFPCDIANGSRILPIGSRNIRNSFLIHLNGLHDLRSPIQSSGLM